MKRVFFLFLLFLSIQGYSTQQAMNQLIYTIRDPSTGSVEFRTALETMGEYLGLRVLEELPKKTVTVQTLTGMPATHEVVSETPVLITILRAGLPFNNGVHKVFPEALVGFLAMSRNERTLKAQVDYIAVPKLEGRIVVVTDTMLATGGSLIEAIRIIEREKPKKIVILAAIAAKPGIERLLEHNSAIQIIAGVVDPGLNDRGFIVPGLGDAGDRCYGEKHISTYR